MSSEFPLTEDDVLSIVRILGDVAAMSPNADLRRTFLMKEAAGLVGTDTWVWAVSPLLEPDKQPVYIFQQTGGFDEARMSRFLMAVEHPETGAITAPLAEAMIKANGQVTRHLDQFDPDRAFRNSTGWPAWTEAGISHVMITLHPLPGYGVSCIGFYRNLGSPPFTERDCRIAHILLSEVPLLHQAGLPHHASQTVPQLPPRCRLIINQLVQGLSRKDIASHLGLSLSTVNGYTKTIFKHFGVHSQSELIARFTIGDGRDH